MPERVEIKSVERVFDGFFAVDRAEFVHEKYDGTMSKPTTRLLMERGDSVGVVLYDRERRRVLLVQQFRFPAYVRNGPGWLWEIIAGMVDKGRAPEEVAQKEAEEEAGMQVGRVWPMLTVFPSPGGSSERIRLYMAPARLDGIRRTAGSPDEGEDILVRDWGLDEALDMIDKGQIVDAKTVIALQYLARHWDELP
ncbi:MAG: NUDIX domain-containing protein [Chloroflexi bacterium]|jgi:ADP-ribose pyrophosphatase|nr:NUDIX domain-containing protein [Chloroflexota bacterium]